MSFSAGQPQVTYTVHTIKDSWARCYLIECPAGLFLVDTGVRRTDRRILKKMAEINRRDLKLIYITHAHLDHYGSAAALHRKTGAPIAIHRADAEAMRKGETPLGQVRGWGKLAKLLLPVAELFWKPEPVQPNLVVEEGYSFAPLGLNAVVLHMPGHTQGSTCLLLEGEYVFAGDLLDRKIQSLYAADWTEVITSFRRLKRLHPKLVFTGHSKPITPIELEKIKYDHLARGHPKKVPPSTPSAPPQMPWRALESTSPIVR